MPEKINPESTVAITMGADSENSIGTKNKLGLKVEYDENGIPILSHQRIILAVAALCVAIFIAALDGTIVATALPTITNKLNAANSAHWLISANLLANTCFQPLFGKISDIFGRKETLILAIVIFEAGSAISGIVNTVNMLIFSRAITGVGAAGLQVMVQIVIAEMVPIRERGKYAGFIGIAFGLASVVGPLIGGLFTDKLSYRWCFFINLPVGLLAGVVIFFLVKTKKAQGKTMENAKRFDIIGALLLVGGLVMLMLGLSFGGGEYPWVSATVLCLIICGLLVIGLYAIYDLKIPREPILPLDLFNQRNVWSVLVAQFFMGFGMYGIIYAAPAYDTAVHNASAGASGVFLLPFVLAMVVFSIGAGIAITKTGRYRAMFRSGTAIMAIGIGMLITINQNTKGVLTGFYLVICGMGCGLCMQAFVICIQATVPQEVLAGATSAIAFVRMLSGALGITVSAIVQKAVLTPKIAELTAEYPESAKLIANAVRNTSLIHGPGVDPILKLKLIETYVSSITSSFIMFCAVLCMSFLFSMLTKHIVLAGGNPTKTDKVEEELA